jgi:hypothetical protein
MLRARFLIFKRFFSHTYYNDNQVKCEPQEHNDYIIL